MDPLAGMDSSTDDDNASQTTEDDPQIPDQEQARPPPLPLPIPASASGSGTAPGAASTLAGAGTSQVNGANGGGAGTSGTNGARAGPRYELRHTLRGHTQPLSAVKFSPDGELLASTGELELVTLHVEGIWILS